MLTKNAQIEDLDQLSVLFDLYRQFYRKESDVIGARLFLNERIQKNESVIIVAEMPDRTLAGFVQLYPIFSSTRMKKLWLLNDLFVLQQYRGKRIGKALIEEAKILCRFTHSAGFILETEKSNIEACQFYERCNLELDQTHTYFSWTNQF